MTNPLCISHFHSEKHKLSVRRLPDGSLQVHDWLGSTESFEIMEQRDVDSLVLAILENETGYLEAMV